MHASLVIVRDEDQTFLKVFIENEPYPVAQILLADHYKDDGSRPEKLLVTIRDWANVTKSIDYPTLVNLEAMAEALRDTKS